MHRCHKNNVSLIQIFSFCVPFFHTVLDASSVYVADVSHLEITLIIVSELTIKREREIGRVILDRFSKLCQKIKSKGMSGSGMFVFLCVFFFFFAQYAAVTHLSACFIYFFIFVLKILSIFSCFLYKSFFLSTAPS